VSQASETVKAKAPEVQAQAEQALKKAQSAMHRGGDNDASQGPSDEYKI
jgi:ElaB/YqjD/DUF883 family membrane-anchored ribosome-binding protein